VLRLNRIIRTYKLEFGGQQRCCSRRGAIVQATSPVSETLLLLSPWCMLAVQRAGIFLQPHALTSAACGMEDTYCNGEPVAARQANVGGRALGQRPALLPHASRAHGRARPFHELQPVHSGRIAEHVLPTEEAAAQQTRLSHLRHAARHCLKPKVCCALRLCFLFTSDLCRTLPASKNISRTHRKIYVYIPRCVAPAHALAHLVLS